MHSSSPSDKFTVIQRLIPTPLKFSLHHSLKARNLPLPPKPRYKNPGELALRPMNTFLSTPTFSTPSFTTPSYTTYLFNKKETIIVNIRISVTIYLQ
jgi:hypothetical protein